MMVLEFNKIHKHTYKAVAAVQNFWRSSFENKCRKVSTTSKQLMFMSVHELGAVFMLKNES